MIYTVDRIENNIAILENKETKEMIDVDINILPTNIHEGAILVFKNNKYILNQDLEIERKKSILEKFNRLRKNWMKNYHSVLNHNII